MCLCVCICLAIGLVFGAPSFNLSRILFYTHFQKEKKSKEWHLTGTEQSDRQTQKKRVSRSEKEKDVVKRQYCSKPVTAQMTDKQTKVAIFARHTLFYSALVVRRRKERHLFFLLLSSTFALRGLQYCRCQYYFICCCSKRAHSRNVALLCAVSVVAVEHTGIMPVERRR